MKLLYLNIFCDTMYKKGKETNMKFVIQRVKNAQVDVDNNEELVKRLGIRSFPTFLVFQNGREMERFSGFRKKEDLMNILIKYM